MHCLQLQIHGRLQCWLSLFSKTNEDNKNHQLTAYRIWPSISKHSDNPALPSNREKLEVLTFGKNHLQYFITLTLIYFKSGDWQSTNYNCCFPIISGRITRYYKNSSPARVVAVLGDYLKSFHKKSYGQAVYIYLETSVTPFQLVHKLNVHCFIVSDSVIEFN